MPNDYINQVKLTDGTVVDIKDTVSGYITSASVPSASSTTPKMDGTAAVGTETAFARGDHIHPTDTSRASLDIVAPEWEPNVDYWEWDSVIYQGQLYFCNEGHVSSSTWDSSKWTPITVGGLAYTMMSEKIDDPSTKTSGQFLKYNGTTWVAGDVPEGSAASSTTPKMDGTASTGSENAFARGDHVHPTDTSRQTKITASGILKGDGSGGVTAATAGTDYMTPADVSSNYVPLSKSSAGSTVTITDNPSLNSNTFNITAASGGSYSSKLNLYVDPNTGSQSAYLQAGSNVLRVSNTGTTIKNVVTPSADGDATNKKYVDDSIGALDGGTIGTGSTTKTITSLSQSNGNVSATFSDIAFPVTSVNGQTGAVTTAEKFVITATAISGTNYYNLDKTFADINVAIGDNKYVTIEDIDMTYPYTTTVSQGVVFGATLIATGEGNQLLAITDGILVVPPDSGTNAMGIAVHSSTVLPTMSDIPSASSTTPSMDGTAAVGTGTTWARADHVHPTDTSRQAVLVSGTNIKTINNESLLGSGNISISAGSSDVFIAEYGTTTYADILAAYEAGKAVFCKKVTTSSYQNTNVVTVLPLAYIGSSDNASSLSRKAIFKNMSGNYPLYQTDITSYTLSGVTGTWTTENIETYTDDPGILSINKSGNHIYLYSNTVNGIVKDDGTGVLSAAIAGTDYQAPLVSGTNIKTINNESLLGSGNISISGGTSNIFVAEYGTTTYAEISTALNGNKLLFCHVSWNNIVCPYIGVVNSQYAFSNLGAGESTVSLYVNSSDTWSYATSNLATKITASGILKGDGSGGVTTATSGTDYQAPLVSGTNIKTINNESLLGSGNINISSGGSSTLFVTVTYANYAYTADTTYANMMSAISNGKDIVLILIDANQQKTWYYTMTYAPKTTTENFCFASEDELGTFKHLLVNNADAWWAADDISLLNYAKKASPAFTGNPTAPTQSAGNNSTRIATTAFVTTAINNAIGSAILASY